MVDISNILTTTMNKNKCSSLYAFLLIKAGEQDGIHICEPKSATKSDRGLRNKGSESVDKEGLGDHLCGNSFTRVYDARHAVF